MSSRIDTVLDAIPVGAAIWIHPASSRWEDAEYFAAVEVESL
jgi:hypothetical protein